MAQSQPASESQLQQQWESDSRAKFYLFCRPHAGSSAARAQRNRYAQLERALTTCSAAASRCFGAELDGDGAQPIWSTGNAGSTCLPVSKNFVDLQQPSGNGECSSALPLATADLLQLAQTAYESSFQRAARELDFSRMRSTDLD